MDKKNELEAFGLTEEEKSAVLGSINGACGMRIVIVYRSKEYDQAIRLKEELEKQLGPISKTETGVVHLVELKQKRKGILGWFKGLFKER